MINKFQVTPEIKNKFFQRCNKQPNGCLIWHQKSLRFHYKYPKEIRANRASIIIAGYSLKKHEVVLSKCGNKQCVNPQHLEITDARTKDNPKINKQELGQFYSGYKHKKQTCQKISKANRGEKNIFAKLTKEDVYEIRSSSLTRKELSLIYKVDRTAIDKIINRKTWKHLR